ncbi:MAG: 1-acyl-sn-glycerol-3-phosphate acyltransferase [Clostridiales bacterium]|nr:1-acyl-sn-glycerol-3-phosphate acyltransferase [Clostridiales bacterium]
MANVRRVMWFAAAWSYLILTYPVILCAKYFHLRGKIDKRNALSNVIILRLSKLMFYLSGSRMQIVGRENIPKDKPVLFVSNHQGHMDSFIIQGFIKKPKGFVTITDYQRAPILRTWMKYMGCVFIDRSDIRQSFQCISQATENLNNGQSMVVFPEGKLNDGKETFEFQKGWLRMAIKSGVPIVPITIDNSHKILSYNGKRIHATRAKCIISKPIETSNLKKANEKEFLQHLRDVILSNL